MSNQAVQLYRRDILRADLIVYIRICEFIGTFALTPRLDELLCILWNNKVETVHTYSSVQPPKHAVECGGSLVFVDNAIEVIRVAPSQLSIVRVNF